MAESKRKILLRSKLCYVLLVLVVVQMFWPFVWVSFPIYGRVVDARTQKGIPGAILVANWVLRGGIVETHGVGSLAVITVITDSSGQYRIPWWGPRFHFGLGSLEKDSLRIRVFSRGYMPIETTNRDEFSAHWSSSLRKGIADIPLVPVSVRSADYADALGRLGFSLSIDLLHAPCKWRDTIPFLKALESEWQRLRTEGLHGEVELDTSVVRRVCNSLEAAPQGMRHPGL